MLYDVVITIYTIPMDDIPMQQINWEDFQKVELRVGTIVHVEDFPEARKPAYKLTIDLGPFGVRKSSAQITKYYPKHELINRQVVCVINFPPKRIGPFTSECLTTGFADESGEVVLTAVERKVPNGSKMF
jgi:tRNA-binding protein